MEKFFVKDFSATTWVRILKFSTKLDSDELYCVTKEQPHIAYQSLYLFRVRILKFSAKLDSDELYCVTKEQPHIAYQSLCLFIFLSLQWKNFSSKISQQLLGLGF